MLLLWTAGATHAASPVAVDDELIVRPRAIQRASVANAVAEEGAATQRVIPGLEAFVVRTPPGQSQAVARRLRATGMFSSVEPNYIAQMQVVPNDALYSQQWAMPVVGAPEAWDGARGTGVLIAIVDTGVEASHPDLAARIVPGFNTITGTTDTADDNGHGTRMAGVAGAVGFNGMGVIGIAPEAQLMPVKALSAFGSGTYADIAEAITYAADHGARVISLSLGGEMASSVLADAVTYAVAHGAVVIAAAGNYGSSAPIYPAAIADAVAVGATDANDLRASFSDYGLWVDLMAPGVGIMTTSTGGTYATSSGTSPATPLVAGTAALVLSVAPLLQPRQVASLLDLSSDDLGGPGFDPQFGWGRLNAERAVEQALALAATPDAAAPAVAIVAPEDGTIVSGTVGLSVDASDDVGVVRVEYFIDEVAVASSSDAPFTAAWDPGVTTVGPHVLHAVAYDAVGNQSSSTAVTVTVAGTQPTCTTPGATCVPGGGMARTDCLAEWLVANADLSGPHPKAVVTCTDGSSCDTDGQADGTCTFGVGVCFAVPDTRLVDSRGTPSCSAEDIQEIKLLAPGIGDRQAPVDTGNVAALLSGAAALGSWPMEGVCSAGAAISTCHHDFDCDSSPGMHDGVCAFDHVTLAGAVGGSERCTAVQPIRVPLRHGRSGLRPGRRKFRVATFGPPTGRGRSAKDTDGLKLVCLPAS